MKLTVLKQGFKKSLKKGREMENKSQEICFYKRKYGPEAS